MGFGLKDKDKGKEKEKEHVRPPKMTAPAPSTPALTSGSVKDKSTSSHGLFSSLTKSRSPSAPQAARARSSDAASSLASIPTASKDKRTSPEKQRLEEYRQLHLRPLLSKPVRSKSKNHWMKRFNMRLHTDYGAPYMQAYDPVLLENDRQTHLLLRRLNPLKNPSFYDFTGEEPISVLDLGCGAGHWLLEAASYWKQAIVSGVDIVDVLLPKARDHQQIDFIQGNFLIFPWPLQNNSYDLVRMANLSLSVPYDAWESILSEVHRILRTNGRFELIDDEIFFPYAPQSVLRPTYVTEDDDDGASVDTDSTLVSDGDASSPSKHKQRQSSTSTAELHVSQQLPPTAPDTNFPTPSKPVLTIKPVEMIQQPHSDWSAEVASCRNIETLFQHMLHRKFGVHSQPSKFAPEVIQHVFGNVEKTKSYHLKLAPKDAQREFSVFETNGSDKREDGAPVTKKSSRSKWFHTGSDKEEKKRSKMISKPSTPSPTSPALETPIPEGLSTKAAGRLGVGDMTMTVPPENVSAKAAYKLGIPISSEHSFDTPSCKADTPPDTSSDDSDTPSPSPSPSPAPAPASSSTPPKNDRQSIISLSASPSDSKLSAKAANRLGISYSELGEATALAKASTRRPVSSSSTLVAGPIAPVQSPGLIVWPDQFIPMSPEELEMHALKNVHMLLGCKPGLTDYIRTFLGDDGNQMASDENLDQAFWEYECFRRRRFNWPTDIPSAWEAEADLDAPDSTPTPISKPGADTPTSAKSATPRNFMPLSSLPDSISSPLDKIAELTHVRTIRVFEAVKMGEYTLSTMQTPRAPPPDPRR
ncbi:hypothetical protein C0993_001015 [Termitomyces sp. T159_Od127]|nr:hypothetical protein C0993_001015 [Termitomyces sp. T159_Od127]